MYEGSEKPVGPKGTGLGSTIKPQSDTKNKTQSQKPWRSRRGSKLRGQTKLVGPIRTGLERNKNDIEALAKTRSTAKSLKRFQVRRVQKILLGQQVPGWKGPESTKRHQPKQEAKPKAKKGLQMIQTSKAKKHVVGSTGTGLRNAKNHEETPNKQEQHQKPGRGTEDPC